MLTCAWRITRSRTICSCCTRSMRSSRSWMRVLRQQVTCWRTSISSRSVLRRRSSMPTSLSCRKSWISGWSVRKSGYTWRISSQRLISRNSCSSSQQTSPKPISSWSSSWSVLMQAQRLWSYWRRPVYLILWWGLVNLWTRSRSNLKITSRSSEGCSPDSTSSPTISYWKYWRRARTWRQWNST